MDQPDMIGTANGFGYHSNMNDCLFDNLLLGEEAFHSSEPSEGTAIEMIFPTQFNICCNFASSSDDLIFK